jgi:hypothetical protein
MMGRLARKIEFDQDIVMFFRIVDLKWEKGTETQLVGICVNPDRLSEIHFFRKMNSSS